MKVPMVEFLVSWIVYLVIVFVISVFTEKFLCFFSLCISSSTFVGIATFWFLRKLILLFYQRVRFMPELIELQYVFFNIFFFIWLLRELAFLLQIWVTLMVSSKHPPFFLKCFYFFLFFSLFFVETQMLL